MQGVGVLEFALLQDVLVGGVDEDLVVGALLDERHLVRLVRRLDSLVVYQPPLLQESVDADDSIDVTRKVSAAGSC